MTTSPTQQDKPTASPPRPFNSDAHMLRCFLTDRDAACPLCGYNLRNLTRTTCPECGREITLGVSLAEPYLTAWLTLLISTCTGAGIGAFFLLYIIFSGLPPSYISHILLPIGFFAAHIPMAFAVVAVRRKLLKRPLNQQWLLAMFALAITTLTLIWLLLVAI